ncbi:MAG: nitroreductase family protein [Bryobacteraceae bacterium]|nr:nitroreductase family protein [Bryobacteraceae bacterium]
MDFFDVVRIRRSIRAYAARPVERDKLQRILEAANAAPSAGNLQAYEIFLVTKEPHRKALAAAAVAQDFIAAAPVVLVFCAHPARSEWRYGRRGVELYCIQDATIACTFAMLAATALGLATCWVGAFRDDEVRRVLGITGKLIPVAILPVGYPGEKPDPSRRRKLPELVHEL